MLSSITRSEKLAPKGAIAYFESVFKIQAVEPGIVEVDEPLDDSALEKIVEIVQSTSEKIFSLGPEKCRYIHSYGNTLRNTTQIGAKNTFSQAGMAEDTSTLPALTTS